MTNRLTLTAPAKINLFLHILGRRPDGYHELQTLFQILDLGDRLQLTRQATPGIVIEGEFAGLPPEQNLIYKAALMLQDRSGSSAKGVRIVVDKRLPMGAGLGGGSSDAATTLVGLNRLWDIGYSLEALAAMGHQLGADVPLFVLGHTAFGEGIGDQLTPINLQESWYLLVNPGCSVATLDVFSDQHLTRDTPAITIPRFQTMTRAFEFLKAGFVNDCEAVATRLYPEIDEVLIWLSKWAPARMTGTGSCVFAVFDTEQQALQVQRKLPAGWHGMVTKGVSESPLHREIRLITGATD